jgi:hypothetical protein
LEQEEKDNVSGLKRDSSHVGEVPGNVGAAEISLNTDGEGHYWYRWKEGR